MTETNYKKFKDSLARLEERYNEYLKEKDSLPKHLVESMKESCIQRFEICFDTSWKHLKKYMEEEHGIVDIANSPNAIFKQAFASKIIEDAELWIEFNKKRGDTTHDYSGNKADEAFIVIGDFIKEAIDLYETMTGEEWKK